MKDTPRLRFASDNLAGEERERLGRRRLDFDDIASAVPFEVGYTDVSLGAVEIKTGMAFL